MSREEGCSQRPNALPDGLSDACSAAMAGAQRGDEGIRAVRRHLDNLAGVRPDAAQERNYVVAGAIRLAKHIGWQAVLADWLLQQAAVGIQPGRVGGVVAEDQKEQRLAAALAGGFVGGSLTGRAARAARSRATATSWALSRAGLPSGRASVSSKPIRVS